MIFLYPLLFRRSSSKYFTNITFYGSKYMTLQIFKYTYPSLVVLAVSLYYFMKYTGSFLSFKCLYSVSFIGVLR